MQENKQQNHSYSALTGFHRAVPIILLALAVFIGLCFVTQDIGILGHTISGVFRGMFSIGAYFVPFLIALHAIFYPSDIAEKRIASRVIFSFITLIFVSVLSYTAANWSNTEPVFDLVAFYNDGMNNVGGGVMGGLFAFLMVQALGPVGVIVAACAIFAIYISYFFRGGKSTLAKVGLAILRAIVSFFALIECGIKKLIAKSKAKKEEKQIAAVEEKTLELTDDEFFDVDNGMQRLEISELGIVESRTDEAIEANPTLHERVFHKSRVDESEEPSPTEREPVSEYTAPTPKRKVVDIGDTLFDSTEVGTLQDIVVEEEPTPEPIPAPVLASPYGIDQSADSVFTKEFDPFSISEAEELASKPSSRSLMDEAPRAAHASVTESITELTEEEVERIKRAEAFERRKEQIVSARKAEETPVRNQGEYTGEVKNIEFHETVTEKRYSGYEVDDGVSVTIEKEEPKAKEPEVDNFDYTTLGFSVEAAPYAAPSYEPKVEQAPYAAPTYEPKVEEAPYVAHTCEPKVGETPYVAPTYEPKVEETPYVAPTYEPKVEEAPYVAPIYEPKVVETPYVAHVYEPVAEEKVSEPTPEFKPYEVPSAEAEEKKGLVFEFDEPETLTVERTMLGGAVTEEADIDEAEEIEEEAEEVIPDGYEEEVEEQEEIPLSEQNPVISQYRDMFDMFRGTDESESEEEEEEQVDELGFGEDLVEEPLVEEDEPIPEDEDEDEEYVEEPEEDEPPFEADYIPEPPKEEEPKKPKKKTDYSKYKFPPIDLLGLGQEENPEAIQEEIRENTKILIETLESFNVTASIKGVDRGPRITRYEVVPARGVKVTQITHLFNDISLNLAAEGVRMEAPIPGKSAIGFEIPNKNPTTVRLRELIECEEFSSSKSDTFVCLGKDVAGNPVFCDIAKFPHALVAGATGMGKSVCINSLMVSMLYKARPDDVKLILIDPKKVEFSVYSGIPHLLVPVVTEAKQAAGALMWAVDEMERRYELMSKHSLRSIDAYNERGLGEKIPKIVIVIDELNDLMMQVRDPVEDLIMRIAQKARAAGIHLIIGTQRPDVKVITGTIKANINTRISCKVAAVVDSRTILEMAGAEKLLNKGDMLFKPQDKTRPIRVQGAFLFDSEVEAVMDFIKSQYEGADYDEEILAEMNKAAQKCGNKKSSGGFDDDDAEEEAVGYYGDPQFLDAVDLAIRSGKVSTSLLQRKLSIGYGKAAKYIDAMEEIGVVSEPNGQKPRDVLITMDDWHEKLSRVDLG